MSKSYQNKVYYEIGIIDQFSKNIIAEYVTPVRVIKGNRWVHPKLMNLMKTTHGENIIILWNKKTGSLPNDHRSVIRIHISNEPELKYNK